MTAHAFDYDARKETDVDPLVSLKETADSSARYFVDFDHTLLLASSTERFLDNARPAMIFAILLKAIGALAPWKLMGKSGYFVWRDWMRVAMVCLLAPWTRSLFSKRAPEVFGEHLNAHLDKHLSGIDPERIIIVSFGFNFIVKAMLRGTRYERAHVVAPGFWSMGRARRDGKILMLAAKGFVPKSDKDVVITDSAVDDADLLSAVEKGYVITWGANNTTGALNNTYIPFFYTAQIKRTPGFFLKQVLLEEMLVLLLAYSLFAVVGGWMEAAALVCFFLANFLVYEIGYAENDRVGLRTEEDPKLSSNFFRHANYKLEPAAWVWAVLVTILGVALLGPDHTTTAIERLRLSNVPTGWQQSGVLAAVWMGMIVLGRVCFWMFNHAPLRIRVFLYIPLHMTKYFGPLVLFPLHFVGFALLIAQIIRTWALYAIRRSGGDIDYVASQLVRLIFFSGMLVMLSVALGVEQVFGLWQTWLLIGFCVLRATPEIWKKLVKEAH